MRSKSENLLVFSLDYFEQIFNQISDCIAFIDNEKYFKFVNNAWAKMHGYSAKEFIGKKLCTFYNEEQIHKFLDQVKEKDYHKDKIRYLHKNGSFITTELIISILKDVNGNHIGLIASTIDNTALKEAEESLKKYEQKLKEYKIALEQKNTFIREFFVQIELEKQRLREEVYTNIDKLLLPIITKLKRKGSSVDQKYLEILYKNSMELASSFGTNITDKKIKLAPREIEICNLIKNGLSTKEISELLNISSQTIDKYRNNIRKKLNLVNKKINLLSYLQSLK
ncbi:MAG: PAS domain S-box protein [Promethearchaeota archaeon]